MEKIHNIIAGVTGNPRIGFLDTEPRSLYIAAASIAFNPIFWNIVARQEYKTHFLTKTFGSAKTGCYALGLTIFLLGIIRDNFYNEALLEQPVYPLIHQPAIGAVCFVVGNVLVLSSMWALGVTGTYLGDYFGILMDEKVGGFPFNVTGAPMYWGSTLSFLGTALWRGRVAGLILTVEVFFMYLVALQFEDPFTTQIYAKRDSQRVTRSMTKEKERKKA